MSRNGAGFDLALDLPSSASRQVGRELHRQLREAIVGGRLQPGLRLPASRELAAALGVSRNTVVTAYDLLLSEGYVSAHGRGGTLVADGLRQLRAPCARRRGRAAIRASPAWRTAAVDPDQRSRGLSLRFRRRHSGSERVSVRYMAAPHRPRDACGVAIRHRLRPAGRARGAARGDRGPHLVARAIACTPDEIVVTAGAQQAFDLLARILVTPGETTVAVEEPGYPPLRNVLAAAGAASHRYPSTTRACASTASRARPRSSA